MYGSLGGDEVPLVPGPAVAPASSVPDPNSAIRRDYELARDVGTKEAWDAFLKIYRDGYYADLARLQRNKIEADEARRKAIEAERQAAEEQIRLAKEGAKVAEQAAAAARAKAAEQARVAAESKAADLATATEALREKIAAINREDAAILRDKARPAAKKQLRETPTKSTAIRRDSDGYAPMGSGKISNGKCNCKDRCNAFAARGQLSGSTLLRCKSDCEQKYSGCIAGSTR